MRVSVKGRSCRQAIGAETAVFAAISQRLDSRVVRTYQEVRRNQSQAIEELEPRLGGVDETKRQRQNTPEQSKQVLRPQQVHTLEEFHDAGTSQI
jgi:hypothetical protein